MPLHEYLEQKRRDNINQLNATGACHICGSKCRRNSEFHHAVDTANFTSGDGYYHNKDSMIRPATLDVAPMRTCSCFGSDPSDPNYWPYSVRIACATYISIYHVKCKMMVHLDKNNI